MPPGLPAGMRRAANTPFDTAGRETRIRFGAGIRRAGRDAGSHADGPVVPTRHANGAGRSGPVASRLSRRPAGTVQHGNQQRPADARQPENSEPGPTAARTPKREIGCAEPRTRLRGTQRGSGVVVLVTRRDSASLRRIADGSPRSLAKPGGIASGGRPNGAAPERSIEKGRARGPWRRARFSAGRARSLQKSLWWTGQGPARRAPPDPRWSPPLRVCAGKAACRTPSATHPEGRTSWESRRSWAGCPSHGG